MSNLYLYRGLPGSGKSTAANRNHKADFVFEADDYFNMGTFSVKEGATGPFYWFDGGDLADAHRWCYKRTVEALRRGYTVAVANTFTRISEMRPYLDWGYPTTIYRMTKNYGSVHDIPEETMKCMSWRFQDYEGEILL